MQSQDVPHQTYLEPTEDNGRALFRRGIEGPVVMLNLIRLRETADYSGSPELASEMAATGAEAFDRYIEHTLPYLEASGGELFMLARGGPFFIGPETERWDVAMLVRQSSIEAFFAFASHTDYLAGIRHRTAAAEDSRLLPLEEVTRLTSNERPPPSVH